MNMNTDAKKIYALYENDEQNAEVKVSMDGSKYYMMNKRLHRINGPAIEYASGSKEWLQNGKMHRVDGPAIEYANGTKEWWVDNKNYDDVVEWAAAALKWEGKEPTKEMIEQKIMQVMQADLMEM